MKEQLTWSRSDPYKSYESWENDYFRIVNKFDTYVMHFVLGEAETTSSNENFDKLVELANVLFESNAVKKHTNTEYERESNSRSAAFLYPTT